jgi:Flp pilus assembly protein TadD
MSPLWRGKEEEGAELLKKAMTIEPDNADVRYALGLYDVRYALGLYMVRKRDYPEALDLLRLAHELMPVNARYAYVYAVALNSTGAHADAMALLEQAHQLHPSDRDVLMALVSIARDTGNLAAALAHAQELITLYPADPQLRSVLSDLEKRQAR